MSIKICILLKRCTYVMILFPVYIIVTATLLVQSFHSAGRDYFQHSEYERNAFPQSKKSHKNRLRQHPMELQTVKALLDKLLKDLSCDKDEKREVHKGKSKQSVHHLTRHLQPGWSRWTAWSSCSVSCGRGRQIRWKHCRDNCDGIETEMEEKTCQLPACGSKLFGFIKL